MNTDSIKYIEIEGRRFQIKKFDAKTSLIISKIIIAKLMPVAETLMPAFLDSGDVATVLQEKDSWGDILEKISLEGIAKALDYIEEDDLNRIIDKSLRHCFEQLSSGPVQVMNKDGSYGVPGIEDDMMIVLRLTAEAVLWSVSGFFDGSRWVSMFKPLAASFKLNASM